MLVCTVMVIRKEKKVGQGILNNIMRTKGEKIHVRMQNILAVKVTLYVTFTVYTCDNVLVL